MATCTVDLKASHREMLLSVAFLAACAAGGYALGMLVARRWT